jgi:DNA polymerase-3 subunit epsilon
MRQVILDTETTGLRTEDGDRIIEIGCIELVNRKFTGKRYHQYINPERTIDAEALAVHGITNQFLETKPLFADIADEFLNFIGDAELVIHNAPFDIGFINYELRLLRKNFKRIEERCKIFDTLVLARQLHIGQRNSLDALCKRYGIDNSNRELHGALLDANLLAQVYLTMTGGQSCLFDTLEVIETAADKSIDNAITFTQQKRELRIIKADDHELSLHHGQLTQMNEKKKCLWLSLQKIETENIS